MKKTMLLFGVSCLSLTLHAQTDSQRKEIVAKYNMDVLTRLSEDYNKAYEERQQRIKQYADKFGVRRTIIEEGRFSELYDIDPVTGKPTYLSTNNSGAAQTTKASQLHNNGGAGLNLEGQNMIAGEWDGGGVLATHQEFGVRVVQKDNAQFAAGANSDHATHVAGTIIASGVSANAKGMAPQATLWANEWNNDAAEMVDRAAEGLLISNHSYGTNPDFVAVAQWGKYNAESRERDNIMFNAPNYLIVSAAGNDRGQQPGKAANFRYNSAKNDYDLVNGGAVAKNCLVVAAVQKLANYNGPASVVMSSFSSYGPTDDGRIKPDIAAAGVNITSCVGPNNNAYGVKSGTSMAAPNTTGSLLLLQQHYANLNNGSFMKAATLKGIAIHTAEEAGTTEGPDVKFGWGLLNVRKGADLITARNQTSLIQENRLNTGTTYSINVVSDGNGPLKATIIWTDPAGATNVAGVDNAAKALINDLDIRITKDGTTYMPWKLDPLGYTLAAIRGDNTLDNVEKIDILNPAAGTYVVTVSHKGQLLNAGQDYSLIVSGIQVGIVNPPGCVHAFEANETLATAATISVNQNVSAAIGTAADVDYYKVTLTQAATLGAALTVPAGSDLGLEIYNAGGAKIDSANVSGNELIAPVERAAGTYYVRVYTASGTAGTECYTLKVNAENVVAPPAGCPAQDNYEPNSTMATAALLTEGSYKSKIYTSTDFDIFKIVTTAANPKIKIVLSELVADYDLGLYSATGATIKASENAGTSSESIIYNATAAGTYYVKVVGWNGAFSTASCYKLDVDLANANFAANATAAIGDRMTSGNIQIAPNPVEHGVAHVIYYNDHATTAAIQIFDINGRQLVTRSANLQKGKNEFTFNVGTTAGIYLIKINGQSAKFIVK